MMTLDEQRKMALLEATLKEILSIDAAAATDPNKDGSMGYDLALDGPLLVRWQRIRSRAQHVLSMP